MIEIKNKLMLLVVGIVALYAGYAQGSRRVVCYYSNWPQYRPGLGRHTVSNVDPWSCTHLVFAFAKIQDSKLKPYEINDMTPVGYIALTNLKNTNPNLVTLLAVGGWNHGPKNFTLMSSTSQNRQIFIQDTISVLRRFNFDGIDLDWEYPGTLNPMDKTYLSLLLQEMKSAFENEATATNRKRLLISAATAAGIENAVKAYDISVLDRTLDMYNVMTYDFHGAWEKFTGLASPMQSVDNKLSVMSTIEWYIQQGANPAKINLGLSLYARTWTLASLDNRLGAAASDPGLGGAYTKEPGSLSHYEVCAMQRQQNMASQMDPLGRTNYGSLGNQFVTFEDSAALKIKTDYIVAMGLGGAMVWSLDHDDFTGQFCGLGKYPLLTVIKKAMAAAPSLPTNRVTQPTQAPTTKAPVTIAPITLGPVTIAPITNAPVVTQAPTTQAPVTQAPAGQVPVCPSQGGYLADPTSCNHYYICLRFFKQRIRCRGNSIFNPNTLKCESPSTSFYKCPF